MTIWNIKSSMTQRLWMSLLVAWPVFAVPCVGLALSRPPSSMLWSVMLRRSVEAWMWCHRRRTLRPRWTTCPLVRPISPSSRSNRDSMAAYLGHCPPLGRTLFTSLTLVTQSLTCSIIFIRFALWWNQSANGWFSTTTLIRCGTTSRTVSTVTVHSTAFSGY